MKDGSLVDKLYAMLETAKEMASLRDPAIEGDIQIIVALLSDKLSYLDPVNYVEHVTEYE